MTGRITKRLLNIIIAVLFKLFFNFEMGIVLLPLLKLLKRGVKNLKTFVEYDYSSAV